MLKLFFARLCFIFRAIDNLALVMPSCLKSHPKTKNQRCMYSKTACVCCPGDAQRTPPFGGSRDVAQGCSRGQPEGASGKEFCTDKWHYTILGGPGHGRSAAGDLSMLCQEMHELKGDVAGSDSERVMFMKGKEVSDMFF